MQQCRRTAGARALGDSGVTRLKTLRRDLRLITLSVPHAGRRHGQGSQHLLWITKQIPGARNAFRGFVPAAKIMPALHIRAVPVSRRRQPTSTSPDRFGEKRQVSGRTASFSPSIKRRRSKADFSPTWEALTERYPCAFRNPNRNPTPAVAVWKGGARERADDVFFCRRHKKTSEQSGLCSDVVPVAGLEPAWITPPHFECGASANFATPAWFLIIAYGQALFKCRFSPRRRG